MLENEDEEKLLPLPTAIAGPPTPTHPGPGRRMAEVNRIEVPVPVAPPALVNGEKERPPTPAFLSERLVSLDAFRGFVMFWIVGGESLARALANLGGVEQPWLEFTVTQLSHVAWEGFRFYDLIFPSFIFIVGVSLVFSLQKYDEAGQRGTGGLRVMRRGLILWVIGIIYYGGLSKGLYNEETGEGVRLLGVLQRIGICYLVAGLLFLKFSGQGLAITLSGIIAGYWALLSFVPVPGQEAVSFAEGENLTNWFDAQYLPFFKWNGTHDPEGILSTLPAIGTCLLGVLAGLGLREGPRPGLAKTVVLGASGAVMIYLGMLWGESHPIIKNLWTSSFVVLAGGWSLVILSGFYLLIEVVGLRFLAAPFVWIGTNPILIYLLASLVSFEALAGRVLGGPVQDWANGMQSGLGEVVIAAGGMLLVILLCRALHQRGFFLRI